MSKSKHKKTSPGIDEVADRLHSAAIHLLRRVRRQDVVMAQAPAQLSALSVLVFGGPMSLGQLAAAEQVKPPTMTRIVTGLERSGLAERIADHSDARKVQVRATAQGIQLMQKGRKARIHDLSRQLEELSLPEVTALEEAIQVLDRVLRSWK